MSETHGKVWWSELMTRDIKGALDYYTNICGWQIDEMPMAEGGTYYIGKLGDAPSAGMMDMTGIAGMDDVPAHWMTYLAVDDVDAAVATTTSKGGQVHRAPFDMPGVGRIAIVADPGGAALGIMTPATQS